MGVNQEKNINSIPLITKTRLERVLLYFSIEKDFSIQNKIFNKIIDTKGSDYSLFLRRVFILKKGDSNFKLTKSGIYLYNSLFISDEEFSFRFHNILTRYQLYYYYFVQLSYEIKDALEKANIKDKYKKFLTQYGQNIPNPSFNSLMSLAKMTGLLISENKKDYIFVHKSNTVFLNKLILDMLQSSNEQTIETYNFILELHKITSKIGDSDLTIDEIWEFLFTNKEIYDIKFKLGIGNGPIAGQYGLMEKI